MNWNLEHCRSPNNILPINMVRRKTIVLKPRFDQTIINQTGEKLKDKLFTRMGFLKYKSSEIKLTSVEKYYDQYLIIKGKYSIDHCKKLVYNLKVNKNTEKVFILNEKFVIDPSNYPTSEDCATINLTGVAHFHYENEGRYVFDNKGREIESEKWSILLYEEWPNETLAKSGLKRNLCKILISTQDEIAFLQSRLIKRPEDVGEIIKEIFEIDERKIILCPMYKLDFMNINNGKEAMAKINGITGNIVITTFSKKTISGKFIDDLIKISPQYIQPDTRGIIQPNKLQSIGEIEPSNKIIQPIKTKPTPKSSIKRSDNKNSCIKESNEITTSFLPDSKKPEVKVKKEKLQFPAKVEGDCFHVGRKITAVGDLEIPPETIVEETIVVKGNLIIGEGCEMLGTIKALGNIALGPNTIVKGNVISDLTVSVGPKVKIHGKVVSKKTINSEDTSTK
jgi:hypothetical protein